MANTFPVKFYSNDSGQNLNGTTGALINMLDRYLVNGGDPISISNISVSNNIATATLVYPYNLDPYFNSVWLLLHGEGTNNGTTFTDSSLNTRTVTTANGSPITSTSQYRFGSSSCYFPSGSASNLWYNTNITFGFLDFTIETWIKVVNKVNSNIFTDANTSSLDTRSTGYVAYSNTSNSGNYAFSIVSTTDISTGGNNGWHHVAVCRYGNTFTLFVNGVPEATITPPIANNIVGSSVYIGGFNVAGCGSYLDEIRLTRGYARYKTDFSSLLPTGPFPNSKSDSVESNQIVTISGGTGNNTVFNDNFRLSSVATDLQTITFPITTNVNPGAVSNMTVKQQSLGWDKPYADTNLAVYRSSDNSGTRLYLRVDDTDPRYPSLAMYETMSGVSSGTPTNVTTLYWAKSLTTVISTLSNWVIVGDSKTFYLLPGFDFSWNAPVYVFGDISSYKTSDAFNCILVGHSVYPPSSGAANATTTFTDTTSITTGNIIARNVRQVGSSLGFFKLTGTPNPSFGYQATGAWFVAYPNPCDNGIHLDKVYVIEYDGSTSVSRVIRGHYRGFLVPFEAMNGAIARKTFMTIENVSYMVYTPLYHNSPTNSGNCFFDLTGPWS